PGPAGPAGPPGHGASVSLGFNNMRFRVTLSDQSLTHSPLCPRVEPQLTLVALNQPHSGQMLGPDSANKMCYEQAKAMGLPPTTEPSSPRTDRSCIRSSLILTFDSDTVTLSYLQGDILFRNWRSIFDGDGARINTRIPIYSFDGRDVLADPFWPYKHIWHGSTSRGHRVVDKHCESWGTDHLSVMGQSSRLSSGLLLGQETRSCSSQFIVLCIETHKSL
uniref:Collagenase NC10/endostatin domain-containing protein n=1 Tax=Neogobius melanostomus TaxID=47308 RepID=A0A8C6TBV6_9GOBI